MGTGRWGHDWTGSRILATALRLLCTAADRQDEETAIAYARQWVVLDPLHEPAQRCLMQLCAGKSTLQKDISLSGDNLLIPFIGRQTELATIWNWLADENGRLLTLIGVGGAGKSRLALEAARTVVGPSAFVPLAALSDPALLVGAIAQALQFSFYGRGDPQTQLIDFLRHKKLLFILDNFEQLID